MGGVIARLALAPGEVFRKLARRRDCARIGVGAVLVMSAAWTGFFIALDSASHAPSGPVVLPIDRADYYAWQAAFVWLVHLAMLGVLAGVLHRMARWLGGSAAFSRAVLVSGVSMALPSIGLWLLPDALVYGLAGFEEMAHWMRYYVPVSVVCTVGLVAAGTRACYALPAGRSVLAAIVATLAHWTIAAVFVR